jgi:hypothetical protein
MTLVMEEGSDVAFERPVRRGRVPSIHWLPSRRIVDTISDLYVYGGGSSLRVFRENKNFQRMAAAESLTMATRSFGGTG